MNKSIVYFCPGVESIAKRKHLVFLEKSGFSLRKITKLQDFKAFVERENPLAVILTDDAPITEVIEISALPIIVLLQPTKNSIDLSSRYGDAQNVIFCRYDNDPIDTVLETVKLILKLNETS
jgi:hypothetical protein